jgi:hypothetical protein
MNNKNNEIENKKFKAKVNINFYAYLPNKDPVIKNYFNDVRDELDLSQNSRLPFGVTTKLFLIGEIITFGETFIFDENYVIVQYPFYLFDKWCKLESQMPAKISGRPQKILQELIDKSPESRKEIIKVSESEHYKPYYFVKHLEKI